MLYSLNIGVDTGGTFTDIVIRDSDGHIYVGKVPGTPKNPADSVIHAVQHMRHRHQLAATAALLHGTTVATNALLERKVARTALVTTRGFRDVLTIGRQNRSQLYAFSPGRPAPLIPDESRFEAQERTSWEGELLVPLALEEASAIAEQIAVAGYEAAAICFLFSYLNPENEQLLASAMATQGVSVSASHLIAPEPREYERMACTAGNAAVAPILGRYLESLCQQADAAGCVKIRVMQSDGGALAPQEAGKFAIRTALSGPAGGVKAAEQLARYLELGSAVTFDMGGTSTDVALLQGGRCAVVHEGQVGPTPLRMAMYDIHTVGAGGGSIARLDSAGALRVGPESAGASPGPVAYGHGEQLTVTDANLVLGRLPAELPLAGSVPLDAERTRTLYDRFAQQLGTSGVLAAKATLELACQSMARAIRHVSTERGTDLAGCSLISFGGAGGLHACELAAELGMPGVIIPRWPGAFSALGLCFAGISREFVRAIPARTLLSDYGAQCARLCSDLHRIAQEWMHAQGLEEEAWGAYFRVDLRYRGQAFDLLIDMPAGAAIDPTAGISAFSERVLKDIADAFHVAHRKRYGHADPNQPVEITAIRLAASELTSPGMPQPILPTSPAEPIGTTYVYADDCWQAAPIYWREAIPAAQILAGPAVVAQEDATTYIPPGWQAATDTAGNMHIHPRS